MFGRCIVLLLLMAGTDLNAQEYFRAQYEGVWQRHLEYSKAVAMAMPEVHYGYQPTDEAMSFQAQFLHIAENISSLTFLISGNRKDFFRKEAANSLKKSEVLDILDNANAYVLDLIQNASDSLLNEKITFRGVAMTKENIFYLIRDHQAHHRAQCLVYLRMNGVKAPGYIGW